MLTVEKSYTAIDIGNPLFLLPCCMKEFILLKLRIQKVDKKDQLLHLSADQLQPSYTYK